MKIIFVLLVGLFITPFGLCLYDKIFGTYISCKTFGWHDGNSGKISSDGCSLHAICSKCGKEVMQDSQGNWF